MSSLINIINHDTEYPSFFFEGTGPWIAKDHRDGLFAYQAGIFKQWDSPALAIGGVEHHIHALFALSKNNALSKIVGGQR